MPIIAGKLHDLKPIITCRITGWPHPVGATELKSIECRALIDTGATDVTVRPHIAGALGLMATGPAVTNDCVGVTHESVPHISAVYLPYPDASGAFKYVGFTGLRTFVSEMHESFDAILGMNLLSELELTLRSDGTFELRTGAEQTNG